jgi:hypothetical protein
VAKIDFADSSSVGATELTVANLTAGDLADGYWNLSLRGVQSFIRPSDSDTPDTDRTRNQKLAQLLQGKDADGDTVLYVDLSFVFKYTGSLASLASLSLDSNDAAFLNMMDATVDRTPYQLFMVGNSDGKAVICAASAKDSKMVLEANTLYTITLRMSLAENAVYTIVTDAAGNETELAMTICPQPISPMKQIGIGRGTYMSEAFSILFDEISLSYVAFK